MKEVKHFYCEVCNTMYNNKETATKCEKSHNTVVKAKGIKYMSINQGGCAYPVKIEVEFSDGQILTYKR